MKVRVTHVVKVDTSFNLERAVEVAIPLANKHIALMAHAFSEFAKTGGRPAAMHVALWDSNALVTDLTLPGLIESVMDTNDLELVVMMELDTDSDDSIRAVREFEALLCSASSRIDGQVLGGDTSPVPEDYVIYTQTTDIVIKGTDFNCIQGEPV